MPNLIDVNRMEKYRQRSLSASKQLCNDEILYLQVPNSRPSLIRTLCANCCVSILSLITSIAFIFSLGLYAMVILHPHMTIDKSVKSFAIPNHKVSRQYEAFKEANKYSQRGKRDLYSRNSLRHRSTVIKERLTVIYVAKNAERNIFTADMLREIHKIEKSIIQHQKYEDYCFISHQRIDGHTDHPCAPVNSLLTYFYPTIDDSVNNENHSVFYDGFGTKLQDIKKTLKFAMSKSGFFWYVDNEISAKNLKSKFLRSEVQFGLPIAGFSGRNDREEEQIEMIKSHVISYTNLLSKASNDHLEVLYGGRLLFDHQVNSIFWSDTYLSLVSLLFIFFVMLFITSFSVWLTFWGITAILCSFPLALFFYRVVFGIQRLGILNGAAAFVVIGIGVDDVFVFINTFNLFHPSSSHAHRLFLTLYSAGRATFFTSFTTAAAFAANIFSSIPAIQDFGVFMTLIVSCCWVTVIMIMPPALNLWLYFKTKQLKTLSLEKDLSLSGSEHMSLLHFDSEVCKLEGGWPTYFGFLEEILSQEVDEEPLLPEKNYLDCDSSMEKEDMTIEEIVVEKNCTQSSCFKLNFSQLLQKWLTFSVAAFVVRKKKVIVAFYLVIVVLSFVLSSKLKAATKPPQLFRSSTNLQKLIDLTVNLSGSDTPCDMCSAFFQTGSFIPFGRTPGPATMISSATTRSPVNHVEHNTGSAFSTTIVPQHTAVTKVPSAAQASTKIMPPTTLAAHRPPPPSTLPPVFSKSTALSTAVTKTRQQEKLTTVSPPVSVTVPPVKVTTTFASVDEPFDPCRTETCQEQAERGPSESLAYVYVVFGIQETSTDSDGRTKVVYDLPFKEAFRQAKPVNSMNQLCRICHYLVNRSDLVTKGLGECFSKIPTSLQKAFREASECQLLASNLTRENPQLLHHSLARLDSHGNLIWLAFSFVSTTFKGNSHFSAYKDFGKWNQALEEIKHKILPESSGLQGFYQTSDFWVEILMEVLAVSSSIYGLLLSFGICFASVALFTGHAILLFIIFFTIIGVVSIVLAIFFIVGWEIGAIEAISLSILVGSSVDYCVHLVGAFLHTPPINLHTKKCREVRSSTAILHIGTSIASSALTTIIAAVPLNFTEIQPFTKFGQIIMINTSVAIVCTFTVCLSSLAWFAPARFRYRKCSALIALIVLTCFFGIVLLLLFLISKYNGVAIPAPGGGTLFGQFQ